jgi:hypothetical protein
MKALWKCQLCWAKNGEPHPITKSLVVLTVHHINNDPTDNRKLNLLALCQRCHNKLDQPSVIRASKGDFGEGVKMRKVIVGLYTLTNDLPKDKSAIFEKIAENGGAGIRYFLCPTYGFYNDYTPFLEYRKWTPDEGGPERPFFKVSIKNPVWWNQFDQDLKGEKATNQEPEISLHDFCSFKMGSPDKNFNPWFSCLEKNDPDPTAPHKIVGGFYGMASNENESFQHLHRKYFGWVVEAVNKVGIKVKYEVMNELGWNAEVKPGDLDHLVAWHGWAVGVLRSLGVAKQDIIASVNHNEIIPEISHQVGIFSFHSIGKPEHIARVKKDWIDHPGFDPNCKILLSSDGYKTGLGKADWAGGKGVSADEAKAIGLEILMKSERWIGFERKAREIGTKKDHFGDLTKLDLAPEKAIATVFGWKPVPPKPPAPPPVMVKVKICTFTNRVANLYCPVTVEVEYVSGTQPTEICTTHKKPEPKPCSYWLKRLDFRRWIKCIFGKSVE